MDGVFTLWRTSAKKTNLIYFSDMRKIQQASLSLVGVLVAAALVGFDSSIASACSSSGSSSSGLTHGSKIGSGSVTVCVKSSKSSAGSTTTQTITKTVTVPAKPKPVPKPLPKPVAKPAVKPAPKPVVKPVTCPSSSQLARVPRSPDAAERWVQSICSSKPKPAAISKPAVKPVEKPKTITITETIVIEIPGRTTTSVDSVEFRPNPLVASVFPSNDLGIGVLASFSSNPRSHFGSAKVLGRQAEVHFVPKSSSWQFSDGLRLMGADTERVFSSAGRYEADSWVEYLVSYRLLGESAWKAVAGTLVIRSNPLEITVLAAEIEDEQGNGGALLVGADCVGREGAFGCDT